MAQENGQQRVLPVISNGVGGGVLMPPYMMPVGVGQPLFSQPQQVQNGNQQTVNGNQGNNTMTSRMANDHYDFLKTQADNNQQGLQGVNSVAKQIISNTTAQMQHLYDKEQAAAKENQEKLETVEAQLENYKAAERKRAQDEEFNEQYGELLNELEQREKDVEINEDYLKDARENHLDNVAEYNEFKENTDRIVDTERYGEILSGYHDKQIETYQQQINEAAKMLAETKKSISDDERKSERLQQKLDDKEANVSWITKVIRYFSGFKDKEAEKMKEKLEKLQSDIENKTENSIQQEKELGIMKQKVADFIKDKIKDLGENTQELINETKDSRRQNKAITEGDEYKKMEQSIRSDMMMNKLRNRKDQIDRRRATSRKWFNDAYKKYINKDINNGPAKYNTNTVNQRKQRGGGLGTW